MKNDICGKESCVCNIPKRKNIDERQWLDKVYWLRDNPYDGIQRGEFIKRPINKAMRKLWDLLLLGADYVEICTDEPELIVFSRDAEYCDFVERRRNKDRIGG